MKRLLDLFLKLPDGVELVVRFDNGKVLGLIDFEMVDYTIYERDDVCVAYIRHIYDIEKGSLSIGNGYEFELGNVVTVQDEHQEQILYRRNLDE